MTMNYNYQRAPVVNDAKLWLTQLAFLNIFYHCIFCQPPLLCLRYDYLWLSTDPKCMRTETSTNVTYLCF